MWRHTKILEFSKNSLDLLFANRAPAVRITNFAASDECERLSESIHGMPIGYYENVSPPIGKIGITQFECRSVGKQKYFAAVAGAQARRREIVQSSFDPVERICKFLKEAGFAKTGVANEPGFGHYFAGLIRQINNSARLHVDVSEIDAPDWRIGKITSQLAWNFYIQSPAHGGDCIIYDREWSEKDEAKKEAGTYGYNIDVVKNAEQVCVATVAGEVILFNCRNFHQVQKADSPRITMGSFIGRTEHNELLLWS